MSTEDEFEYFEPSNIGECYLKHVEAMKPIKDQPQGKSFAINKDDYSLSLLRDIADCSNVGKKAIVVIEHEEVFEVQRLPDGSNTKLFYRYSTGKKRGNRVELSECEDSIEEIKRILKEYVEDNLEECIKYDKNINAEIKAEKIVSYAYVQRRCIGLAAFKKAPEGAAKRFKVAIEELVEEGYLKAVPKMVASGTYETSAKLYQIIGTV